MYYNEWDPFAAEWIRQLIKAGQIPPGVVDERDIRDVSADDVRGYGTCHFFAGIGGWPYALQLAGWGDRPVWTASCPCQPFSQAGQQKGTSDERHLWPVVCELIAECRPSVIFGEQVASPLGREWFTGVRLDLENLGYAVGCADLCAASIGAPHIRQRLFWVGDSCRTGLARRESQSIDDGQKQQAIERTGCATCGMGNTNGTRSLSRTCTTAGDRYRSPFVADDSFDIIPCRDGKTRRTQSGVCPLAHGVSNRVGRLRGFGNAIVAPLAATFIQAFMMTTGEPPAEDSSTGPRKATTRTAE